MRVRPVSYLNDPGEVSKSLEPGFKRANSWMRRQNKEIMLMLIEPLLEPSPEEKKAHVLDVAGTFATELLVALFSPVDHKSVQEHRENLQARPSRVKELNLERASYILDRLSHRNRLEYFHDALTMGVRKANLRWLGKVPR